MATIGDVRAQTAGNYSYPTVSPATPQPQAATLAQGTVAVQGYVSEADDIDERPGSLIPIAGAAVYFVYNNQIAAQAITSPVGFYSVTLPAGSDYTVAVSAVGFQPVVQQADFSHTRTYNVGLTPIPFNGFVPYALYPVLESSPGREFDCTLVVQNFQVIDQMVTFTVITPPDMQAWFPMGEAMMVRSGDSNRWAFKLKYLGTALGPQVLKVVVNGGAYFAEIPVVAVIKDLPYEEVYLWSYAPEKVVKPGDTAAFIVNVENKYALDKDLQLDIGKPEGWSVTTGNGTELYVPDGMTGSSYLWVYVPEGTPLYDAIIKGPNRTVEGYPMLNLSAGQTFSLPVRVYNSWDFPVSLQATAQVGDDWYSYVDGVPNGHVYVEPGKALEFAVRSRVPNDTYGNFTARVYLEASGQTMTLQALITVPEPPPVPKARTDWGGIAMTGVTAVAIAITVGATWYRRQK
ncbi:MAG TPA: hypothetical protein VLT35_06970 [Methanocella sp.]|nr:hypothetical protein [Methanocella sp.]